MAMYLQFFGVRGSYPVPDTKMMNYGGRTASVMFTKKNVEDKNIPLFVDAGLGFIEAGKAIMPGIFFGSISKTFTVLFTHLHPDHTEGFTFFGPNFLPDVEMHLLGPASLKKNVGIVLRDKMAPPTYPIEYKDLKSKRIHGVVEDGDVLWIDQSGAPVRKKPATPLFEVKVMQSFAPSHPQQGSIYYRVTDPDTGKSVVCLWDIESRRGGDQRAIAFSRGCDALIHDSQYTDEEYDSTGPVVVQGFGHSTYTMALENARLAGAKVLIPFHYNPSHTDEKLDEIEKYVENLNELNTTMNGDEKVKVIMSKEGLTLEI